MPRPKLEIVKDTHREKAPSKKLQRLEKYELWAFGLLVH